MWTELRFRRFVGDPLPGSRVGAILAKQIVGEERVLAAPGTTAYTRSGELIE